MIYDRVTQPRKKLSLLSVSFVAVSTLFSGQAVASKHDHDHKDDKHDHKGHDHKDHAKGTALTRNYNKELTQLTKNVNRYPDAKKISAQVDKTINLGKQVIEEYLAKSDLCKAYLKPVLDNFAGLTALSLEKIEADYHGGKLLPKSPDPICYQAKDLIVHPATVAVLVREKGLVPDALEQMKKEIREAAEHLKSFQQGMDK